NTKSGYQYALTSISKMLTCFRPMRHLTQFIKINRTADLSGYDILKNDQID
ncbi:MAG: hypothetical protein RL637_791, partial [Pseudomonadota bacterium]